MKKQSGEVYLWQNSTVFWVPIELKQTQEMRFFMKKTASRSVFLGRRCVPIQKKTLLKRAVLAILPAYTAAGSRVESF